MAAITRRIRSIAPSYLIAPPSDYDGLLETHEVYGLDLSAAEMVVLSACQTNVGEVSRGDDIGLASAFFYPPHSSLACGMWMMRLPSVLMSAFYRQLEWGKRKPCRQRRQRCVPIPSGAFYWAAFVLNGEPDNPPNPIWRLMRQVGMGIAGLTLLLIAGMALPPQAQQQINP